VLSSEAVGAWHDASASPTQPSKATLPRLRRRVLMPLRKSAEGNAILPAAGPVEPRPVSENLMIGKAYASIR
jgi:hypothetical protein